MSPRRLVENTKALCDKQVQRIESKQYFSFHCVHSDIKFKVYKL